MCLPQLVDYPSRFVRYIYALVHSSPQKKPIAFLSYDVRMFFVWR